MIVINMHVTIKETEKCILKANIFQIFKKILLSELAVIDSMVAVSENHEYSHQTKLQKCFQTRTVSNYALPRDPKA